MEGRGWTRMTMVKLGTLKRVIPLVLALVLGVLAMWMMRQYLNEQRQAIKREWERLAATYQEPVQVVVAARDLSEGNPLEASHLTAAMVPDQFIQPYAARAVNEVLGLVTVAPIAEGEQVLLNKLRRPEAVPKDAILSSLTPKGKRAVTIVVDAITGVGGFVRPGDEVDVLWTIQLPESGQQPPQPVTMTLFQDVPILAVGAELVGRVRGTAPSAGHQESGFMVTLALTPQEISFLLFAREQGRIQLSLRPRQEDGAVALVPANINTLMQNLLGVPPAPAARAPRQVEVYKGLKRDVVLLPE